jgi:AcrR family transcriptional regulator
VPLTREQILEKALELADERGVEALKMRDLGRALGVEGMALYRHVANKDDLLDGVLDRVLGEVEPPSADGYWLDAVRASALSVHRALERHPWATRLLLDPERVRPALLAYGEALLARLEEAGFSDDDAYHAYHVLDAHIFGYALWLAGHMFSTEKQAAARQRVAARLQSGGHPHFAKHIARHRVDGPHREVDAFEIGLDLILKGLDSKT